MPKQQSADATLDVLEDLTMDELALLETTNPRRLDAAPTNAVILTAKEAYLLATVLARLVESNPTIDADDILPIYLRAASRFAEGPETEAEVPNAALLKLFLAQLKELSTVHYPESELEAVFERATVAYRSLVEKDLIEDPIEIAVGGIAVAVLGLIPVAFSRKTKQGEELSLKINSLFLSYERSKKLGVTTVDVRFNLIQFVRAFYTGLVGGFRAGFEEAAKGRGRPPAKS